MGAPMIGRLFAVLVVVATIAGCAFPIRDNAIPMTAAINIARNACKQSWTAPKITWGARLESSQWHVWTPRAGDIDANTGIVFQVWMDAMTGNIRKCQTTILE
jgi:hypothetical protein